MILDNIVELATDNDQSVSALLRKCIVLAHRIENEKLKTWANKELSGYAHSDTLPDYRIAPAQAKGNFAGWGGAQLKNWLIPPAVLEPRHQRFAKQVDLRQAISAYEDLVKSAAKGSLVIAWPSDLVLYYQERLPISSDMNLVYACQEITRGALVGVIDAVRNRVLNMALEIQAEFGAADDDLKRIPPKEAERLDQAIVQHIYGGHVFVATGRSNMTVHQQTITAGSWDELQRVLHSSGLPQSDIDELSGTVAHGTRGMSSGVLNWIKKNATKVVSAGVKIGASAGQAVLTEYLKQYFGLS